MTVATTENTAPATVATGSVGGNLIREAAAVMADAHALAKAVCNTAMVPKHFQGKPDDTAAAMLYGASLGLDPMQAIRAIYVVHGAPGLYAKSMAGLAAAAGHETWTAESTDESVTVCGRRKGSSHVESATWTIERATKAGYVPTIDPETGKYRLNKWGKVDGNEKYLTDPQAMLRSKALAEVCRNIAPDVLAGVYAVEELQSERFTVEQVEQPRRGLAAALAPQASGPDEHVETTPVDASGPEAPPETGEAITKAQLTKLHTVLTNLGMGRDEGLAFYASVTGREVDSSKSLSKSEAREVIDALEAVEDQPFPDAGEPVVAELVEGGEDQ